MIIILATMNGNEKKNLYFDDFSSYNNVLYATCIIINNIILGKWYTDQGDKNNNNGN